MGTKVTTKLGWLLFIILYVRLKYQAFDVIEIRGWIQLLFKTKKNLLD